ncbi:MAG: sigma-54-dependent transcriptional regulator [Calditrichaceae bacterium]
MEIKKVLLIDDNEAYCIQVQKTLALRGMELKYHTDAEKGLNEAITNNWNAILADVVLNQELNGLDILKKIVEVKPNIPVIMVSGASTIRTAVDATKMGAYDFLEKPVDIDRLTLTINRAIEKNELTLLSEALFKELSKQFTLIGKSKEIRKVYQDIKTIAPTDTKVLLMGESGVGKDLLARIIHYHSIRETHSFVSVNCASIPMTLVESVLFGYEKGAFTGATTRKEGLIAEANNGTLFLDEIAELPLEAQGKLLKFLNDGEYQRVGGTDTIQSRVRIIAATNKILTNEVKSGRFRDDLFYRLNAFSINIPPLRERVEDIPLLAEFYLRRGCEKYGKTITHFSDQALELIKIQPWKGNVRQLKSAVFRMVLFSNSNIIDYGTAATAIQMDKTNDVVISSDSYQKAMGEFEKLYLLNRLHINNWDLDLVAKDVQISRKLLEDKLRKLQISLEMIQDE